MQKTLGVFVNREHVVSLDAFFAETWQLLLRGPAIIQPKRCGNCEPLQLVQDVDLRVMLRTSFFTSNGRRSLCSVWPPAFSYSRCFSMTILLELKYTEEDMAREVYDWLKKSYPGEITYMGTPTQAMFENNAKLHQILNCGASELQLPVLREGKHHLDYFCDNT